MTTVRVALIDLYLLRGSGSTLEVLLLHRARGPRKGSWEMVHGHIDAGETPVETALREMQEETSCMPIAFYNLSRVEQFYLHLTDEIALIPAFAAFVAVDAAVHLSDEHDAFSWLSPAAARAQCTWPRGVEGIDAAVRLLGTGNGGMVEDVLRVR